MPYPRAPIVVQSEGTPDLDLAAGAILPLFLGFLEGRAARKAPPGSAPTTVPARAHEESRDVPT